MSRISHVVSPEEIDHEKALSFHHSSVHNPVAAWAGPAPKPQPGMEVIHWNRHGEIQVATDIDWSRYSKVIIHTAPGKI